MRPLIGALTLVDYADIGDGVFAAQHATAYLQSQGAKIVIPTEHRWWEYGTAIQMLLTAYGKSGIGGVSVLDVGAGWSAFGPALAYTYGTKVTECEPGWERRDRNKVNQILTDAKKTELRVLDATTDTLPLEVFDMVACISVIEHMPVTVEDRAWSELVARVKPGGLLLVTVDCVFDAKKSYEFDHLRAHNFTVEEMRERVMALKQMGMQPLRGEEYKYNGDFVHGYTFFRIGMRKES